MIIINTLRIVFLEKLCLSKFIIYVLLLWLFIILMRLWWVSDNARYIKIFLSIINIIHMLIIVIVIEMLIFILMIEVIANIVIVIVDVIRIIQ